MEKIASNAQKYKFLCDNIMTFASNLVSAEFLKKSHFYVDYNMCNYFLFKKARRIKFLKYFI